MSCPSPIDALTSASDRATHGERMAIISHTHGFIFLATAKTASSSVEASLARYLGRKDWVRLTTDIGPIDHPFLRTSGRTTSWFPKESAFKSGLSRTGLFRPLRLKKHSTAEHVLSIVGERIWDDYLTFAVERDPWDRFISLWRWRTRKDGRTVDEFLEEYEREFLHPPKRQKLSIWRTWPIYAIGDEIAVDRVVRYENLEDELAEVLAQAGVEWDHWLPRLKSKFRQTDDRVASLTASQIERIGELCDREIEANGYKAPEPTG